MSSVAENCRSRKKKKENYRTKKLQIQEKEKNNLKTKELKINKEVSSAGPLFSNQIYFLSKFLISVFV